MYLLLAEDVYKRQITRKNPGWNACGGPSAYDMLMLF